MFGNYGIPEELHEDTNEIVIRVGRMIGVEIEKSDISVSHRLPTKQSYSNVARLQGKDVKSQRKSSLYKYIC